MKTFGTIITAVLFSIAGIAGWNYFTGSDTVTMREFNEAHQRITHEFDSVKTEFIKVHNEHEKLRMNQETLINEVGENGFDLDTLKCGQERIYESMQENVGKKLINDLFNF